MSKRKRPNVIFILADDQGWGDFELNGNDTIKTPTLTRLAASGVSFRNFYVSPVCAPSRASFLTGRYHPHVGVTGVSRGFENMDGAETTIAEVFQASGYRTACIGKWHNGKNYPQNPMGQGFEYFFGFCSGGIGEYFDPELEFGYKTVNTVGYVTDILTDSAIRFIDGNKDRPFFCYIPYNAPHTPYQVPDSYYDYYTNKGCRPETASVYGMVTNLDENVRRIIDHLEATGLIDNTIIVYSSDNGPTGPPRFNGNLRGKKGGVDEGGIRVPMYISYAPVFRPGTVVDEVAAHIDLLPTLADACDLDVSNLSLDGVSLFPLMTGMGTLKDRYVFTQYHNTQFIPGSVRTNQFRMTLSADDTALFDIVSDPSQKNNVLRQNAVVGEQLLQKYTSWIHQARDVLGKRPPVNAGFPEAEVIRLTADESTFGPPAVFFKTFGYNSDWITGFGSPGQTITWDLSAIREQVYHVEVLYTAGMDAVGTKLTARIGTDSVSESISAPFDPSPFKTSNRIIDEGNSSTRKPWARLALGNVTIRQGNGALMLISSPKPGANVSIDVRGIELTLVSR